jgi:hypothetical protein
LRGCQTHTPLNSFFRLPTRPYPNWGSHSSPLSRGGCKHAVSHRDAAHWGGLQGLGEHCYTARHATATYRAPPRLTSHGIWPGLEYELVYASHLRLHPLFPAQLFGSEDITTTRPFYFSLLLGSVSLVINITLTLDLASTQQQTRELPFFRNFLCRRCSSL